MSNWNNDRHVDDGMRHSGLVPTKSEREEESLHKRIADLEADSIVIHDAIARAPHMMGCRSIQDDFLHTAEWATLEHCDCWKRDLYKALEGKG